MATVANVTPKVAPSMGDTQATSTVRYDAGMLVFAVWFFVGLFLDGAAHNRGAVDSFFTPWHLILYSGFTACAGWIMWGWSRNLGKGYTLFNAIPRGYKMSVVGAAVFAVGGVLDLIWHTVFGIERGFEALVSPSHLILALGLFLIMNGPFRAAWWRPNPKSNTLWAQLPMVLSLIFTFSILTFFTMSLNPLGDDVAGKNYIQGLSGVSLSDFITAAFSMFLLQSAIISGCLLMAMRRWVLPFGTVTLYLTLNMLAMAFIASKYEYLPIAIITGLVADTLITLTKPSPSNPLPLRLVAFVVPGLFYLLYFVVLSSTQGVWWSVPLWSGAFVMSGAVGVLLSYLMVPSPELTAAN